MGVGPLLFVESLLYPLISIKISRHNRFLASVTIGMIGNEGGILFTFAELSRKLVRRN